LGIAEGLNPKLIRIKLEAYAPPAVARPGPVGARPPLSSQSASGQRAEAAAE